MKIAGEVIKLCEVVALKVLGIEDAIHVCDRCGKKGLKHTYVVDVGGEIGYFGSECINKLHGIDKKTLNKEAREQAQRVRALIYREVADSEETKLFNARAEEARKNGLIGRAFKDFVQKELLALTAKEKEVKDKYDISKYKKLRLNNEF